MKTVLRCAAFAAVLLAVCEICVVLTNTRQKPLSQRSWHSYEQNIPSEFDLRIIVLTYNRGKSLNRLLESLNKADYFGDRVHIDVWLDRSKKDGAIHVATYQTAVNFTFNQGSISVHNHTRHVGIYGQWIDTWKVDSTTEEMAVILEDDLTVSKYFYKWLKLVHSKYDHLPYINGYSLQGRSIKHSGSAGHLHAPETEVLFAYPVVGAWGFSPKRDNWIKFVTWYHNASLDPKFVPSVPGLVASQWYSSFVKAGKADSMWTMWHIYYAYKHHELTVYPNFPFKQGLSINFEESGLHYTKSTKNNQFTNLQIWNSTLGKLPSVPIELNANGDVIKY